MLRYGFGIDMSNEPEELQEKAAMAKKKQEEDNDALMREICEKLGR